MKNNPYFYLGENPTVDLIVINPSNEVLMIKRSSSSAACPSMLAFPGGFIDSSAPQGAYWLAGLETPEEAALRELKEETNLELNLNNKLIFIGEFIGNGRDPRDNLLSWSKSFVFLYHIEQSAYDLQKSKIKGLDDAEDAMWISLSVLRLKSLAFDHNQILERAIGLSFIQY